MRRLKRAHQKHVGEQTKRSEKLKQKVIAAGAAAAITLGTSFGSYIVYNFEPIFTPHESYITEIHESAVVNDADGDLLTNNEESAIGYRVLKSDQNLNRIPDGVELAKRCSAKIDKLPVWDGQGEEPNEIYKIEIWALGMETCDICGAVVNMGGIEIVNPALNMTYPGPSASSWSTYLPFITLHYMEHGSFSYAGDYHTADRVYNLQRLMRVLELRYPYEPNEHELPLVGKDLDGDHLTDIEELEAGFNLYDSDQDKNLIPDGIELAKQCADLIDRLPGFSQAEPNEIYKSIEAQLGLEICDICGEVVNMGNVVITNPKLGATVDFPILSLHYMKHGSFSYAGNVHGSGRIDVAALVKVLNTKGSFLGYPVYRFWSSILGHHFYTINETEKNNLIDIHSNVWTYENVAFRVFQTDGEPGLMPVYRFWSPENQCYFYTLSESEKKYIVANWPNVWTYENIAFYAWPAGQQPADAKPVYRFWSETLSSHFYTINETEKNKIIDNYQHVWTFEGIAWYAY